MSLKYTGLSRNVSLALLLLLAMLWLPAVAYAGDLDPDDPPGPTMRALDETPPAWSQILPSNERFELVLNDEAVLDKETGLVWERSPDTTLRAWSAAIGYAFRKTVGGRKGWRLPTISELASLIDPAQSNLALPNGYPFLNVQSGPYWSSTTHANNPDNAWRVNFADGDVYNYNKTNSEYYAWCVRGGQGHDAW